MPTREAYAVAVLTLLIFFVAFNLQSGWVYALDALLAGLVIAGFFGARHAVWRVSVTRALPAEAVEGESVSITLALGATGFGRRFFVEVLDQVPGLQPAEVFIPAVDSRRTVRTTYAVTAVRRGIYRVHTAVVRSGGLAGIFAARREVPVPGLITIYPRHWKISRFPLVAWTPTVQAAGAARRRGGLEFYGLRDYRMGDSLRHVHWRSSARRGALIVREFEQEVPGSVTLLLDARPEVQSGSDAENTFEDLIRAAASVTWYIVSCGGAVRLLVSTAGGPLNLTAGWKPILQVLAGLKADGRLTPAQLISTMAIGRSPSIIALTPDLGALAALAESETSLAAIVADPASYPLSNELHEQRAAEVARITPRAVAKISTAIGGLGLPLCVIRRGDDIGARLEQSAG